MKSAIYMIESGKALALVKHHIEETLRVADEARALAKAAGADRFRMSFEGRVFGVDFKGDIPAGFTKPGRFGSRPKKGTEWAKRFADQKGMKMDSVVIADAFEIPLSISYEIDGGWGSTCIGNPFRECGFLYLSVDGPYAMWVPDVEAYVADFESRGKTVTGAAKSYRAKFDGCRRIEHEEWDILVAQHQLDKKRAAKAGGSHD